MLEKIKKRHVNFAYNPMWSIKFALFLLVSWAIAIIMTLLILKLAVDFLPLPRDIIFHLNNNLTTVSYVLYIVVSIGLIVFLRAWLKKNQLDWRLFGLRNFDKKRAAKYLLGYPMMIVGGLLVIALVLSIIGSIFNFSLPENSGEAARPLLTFSWIGFVATVFVTPFVEELLFRGVLLPALAKRLGTKKAAVLSSAIFAVSHANPIQLPSLFITGLYLSFMYYRLGSIVPGMILHAAHNAIFYLIMTS